VTVCRRLQWTKRPSNNEMSTTASRRSQRYTNQGQRLTDGLWPRRCACDGEVTVCEEEGDETRVPGEDKPNWWVRWTCKVTAELEHALSRRQWH